MSDAPKVLRFYDDELSKTLEFMTRGGNNKYVRADHIGELEAKLNKAVEALQSMPEAVVHTTLDDGPLWPEDRTGVWLAALDACKNVVQLKVDQTLAELKGQANE